ncbi:MAG: hypothetical protein JO278_14060 [Dyella sp.]|nr:hypothetical protein [Dyella sp.]
MLLHGQCHCGNIAFSLSWEPDPDEIPARACDCSFCTRHGGVWTSYPDGHLRVSVQDPALVSRYAFGTRTAEFHVCARCGVVPLVTSLIGGQLYAVINVHALDNIDPSRLRHSPASFGEEAAETRLARRQRYWIKQVEFV